MSQAVKDALKASKDLRTNERLVMIAVAAHTNGSGAAWPSVATIAEYVGVSTRTVQRTLVKLVKAGHLVVSTVAGIATRVYRAVTRQAPPAPNQGATKTLPGVTDSATGGDKPPLSVSGEVQAKKDLEELPRAKRDWTNWVPKNKKTNPSSEGWPVRQGAANPPAAGSERCPLHQGSLRSHCGPCRSETVGAA